MTIPTDSQLERYSVLWAAITRLPVVQRAAAVQALCDQGQEDPHVLALVRLRALLPPEPDRVRTGERIDDTYTLVELLGAGGMGVVYRAHQGVYRHSTITREVAVKLINPDLLRSVRDTMVARFVAELRALVTLEAYEGIPHVYAGDIYTDPRTGEQIPYIAMQLVRGGRPITTYVTEQAVPLAERLALFLRVCRAIRHAHEHALSHGDLKPANILVDSEGRPFVIDFGLARAYDELLPGAAVVWAGTPAYMSPEQVSDTLREVVQHRDAEALDIIQKSDVYALGIILYELLTGHRPYAVPHHGLFSQIRHAITAATPLPLGQHRPAYRGALEAIVAGALAKHPAQRVTVQELQAGIERYLNTPQPAQSPEAPGQGRPSRQPSRRAPRTPPARAQKVAWGVPHGRGVGIIINDRSFIPWERLKPEIDRRLLPQVQTAQGRNLPDGTRADVASPPGKPPGWFVELRSPAPENVMLGHIWFGKDPDRGWIEDGNVRVGDAAGSPSLGPSLVWQTYTRYSDGTYRRIETPQRSTPHTLIP
jgi:serine/threonine protein kinase